MQLERREYIAELFRGRYGCEPQLWARAPGRVDLMGSHTDYNLGYVLTLPISRDTWMAVRKNGTRNIRLLAANLSEDDSFSLDGIEKTSSTEKRFAAPRVDKPAPAPGRRCDHLSIRHSGS